MSIRLMAVGDMALRSLEEGQDPFEYVRQTLGEADLVFGNLEAPLTSAREPAVEKAEPLRAAIANGAYLRNANVSVVNLANNHIADYGPTGLFETIEALQRIGVGFVGAGRTISEALREFVATVHGATIAFVGFYDQGTADPSDGLCLAGMDPQLVIHRIAELSGKYDFVAVSLHWGIENVYYPSPDQQALARVCIDAGAAVILGHHPHRFHGVEVYKGKAIFYSLGNFNFMRCGDAGSDSTAIADITLRRDGALAYDLIPARIGDDYRPRPVTDGREAAEFRAFVERISRPLPLGIDKWWWFGEVGGPYLRGNLRAFRVRIRRYGLSHAIEMLRWLTGRFVLKCYVGVIRHHLGRRAK